jgi:sterol 3beta-glucosyltransferase
VARRLPPLLEGSDLVLGGTGGISGGFAIAQSRRIPILQAYVFPFMPTHEFASPLFPALPSVGVLNWLSFQALRQMLWQTSKAVDAATRQLLKLPKGSFWGPFAQLQRDRVPALYGYSQYVVPRPYDWPENHQVSGYWVLDTPDDWEPPSDLVDFLNAGDPPVYIGFGSMVSRSAEKDGQIALEALAKAGQRGVVATGWGGLKVADLPDSVHLIASIPHSWLFPRMAAVVHHGGAGTTAAGLRAGVPSVIIPFMGDQVFWGRRVADLGVGTSPIPKKQLTTDRLVQAIQEMVSNTKIVEKARGLGEKIRAEDGVANLVEFVEHYTDK